MRHVIIGKGNLGVDIHSHLLASGETSRLVSRCNGFDFSADKYNETFAAVFDTPCDVVWLCVGGYSVENTLEHYTDASWNLLGLPVNLALDIPRSKHLVLFSSDYCADEQSPTDTTRWQVPPTSLYASIQQTKEYQLMALQRPRLSIVRVGSLYGSHFPNRSLPGKLAARYPDPCKLSLPMNLITPTWTKWVAEHLWEHKDQLLTDFTTLGHAAPKGSVSVLDFGRTILGHRYTIEGRGIDANRPTYSAIGSSYGEAPNWLEVFTEYRMEQRRALGFVAPVYDLSERRLVDDLV